MDELISGDADLERLAKKRASSARSMAKYRAKHKDDPEYFARKRRYSKENRDRHKTTTVKERNTRNYNNNREKRIADSAEYRAANKERLRLKRAEDAAKRRETTRRWREENPEKAATQWSIRRAGKSNPKWADRSEIIEIYKNCPEGMVVDHIVPLKGRTVEGYRISGLHVSWNLQYLTPEENSRKLNRMRPEDQSLALYLISSSVTT